jgi:hypothetical protein
MKKEYDHILKDLPALQKISAKNVLELAKKQEKERIKEGWHFVSIDYKTKVLRKN